VGDAVKEGDTIAIIESMKTEIPVIAGTAGIVSQVFAKESSEVRAGQCLISLKPIPSPGT
jgi:urea carboxylase